MNTTARRIAAIAILMLMACRTTTAGETIKRASASEKGSLLVLPNIEVRFNSDFDLTRDTFVTVTNDFPGDVRVFMLMVNGDPFIAADPPERAHPGWNWIDQIIELQGSQPAYWSAFTGQPAISGVAPLLALDPGFPPGRPDPEGSADRTVRSSLYVWAIDEDKNPIQWNHLSATATLVDYERSTATEWKAYAFQRMTPADAAADAADGAGMFATLDLDGAEYAAPFDRLLLDFQAVGSTAFSGAGTVESASRLALQVVTRDFRDEGCPITPTLAQICVWNENETKFIGVNRCVTVWDQTALADFGDPNPFLRTVLQTDHGFARIDGIASAQCDVDVDPDDGTFPPVDPCDPQIGESEHPFDLVSADAPLLGVVQRTLTFDGAVESRSGTTLRGEGAQADSRILYTTQSKPPCVPPAVLGMLFERLASEVVVDVFDLVLDDAPDSSLSGATPEPRIGASQKGSLLVYPHVILRWNDAGELIEDTFLTIQNTFPDEMTVRLRFVNGDEDHNDVPATLALTGSQPAYWSAATGLPGAAGGGTLPPFTALDPGPRPGRPDPEEPGTRVLRGSVYAWAVDAADEEIRWNHLTGSAAVVRYDEAITWDYNAPAVPVVDPAIEHGAPTGTPGVLNLDGSEFAQGYSQLLLEFPAVGGDSLSTMFSPPIVTAGGAFTMHPLTLRVGSDAPAPITTKANTSVWNQNSVKFLSAGRCITGWAHFSMAGYDPMESFDVDTLQTPRGYARFQGVASIDCDVDFDPFDGLPFPPGPGDPVDPRDVVSEATSLVGAASQRVIFDDGAGTDRYGSTMNGLGLRSASVVAVITPGACCFDDGSCGDDVLPGACMAAGGRFIEGLCAEIDCGRAGACCIDGSCLVAAPGACEAAGGFFGGGGTSCVPNPCTGTPGACCLISGACIPSTILSCAGLGGAWQDAGSSCDGMTCREPMGACCLGPSCVVTTLISCASSGGVYQGTGSTCAACAPIEGACCLFDGTCDVRPPIDCTSAVGVYQGNGTECASVVCPAPPVAGACCYIGGTCDDSSAPMCLGTGGTYEGDGTTCAATTCPAIPVVGVCCYANDLCGYTLQAPCLAAGGTWQRPRASCETNPCRRGTPIVDLGRHASN